MNDLMNSFNNINKKVGNGVTPIPLEKNGRQHEPQVLQRQTSSKQYIHIEHNLFHTVPSNYQNNNMIKGISNPIGYT